LRKIKTDRAAGRPTGHLASECVVTRPVSSIYRGVIELRCASSYKGT